MYITKKLKIYIVFILTLLLKNVILCQKENYLKETNVFLQIGVLFCEIYWYCQKN